MRKSNKNTQIFSVKKELPRTETIEKNFSKNQTKNPENGVEKEPSVVAAAHLETKVIPEASRHCLKSLRKKYLAKQKKLSLQYWHTEVKNPNLLLSLMMFRVQSSWQA